MAADYNSVPLGQAGTGAAFILPNESLAANRLLETIDYNQQIAQRNALLKQQAAQQLAKSYQDNIFKAKNGQLFNSELMGLAQKHIQQGIDYAKQGWDIYNPNPNNPAQMKAYEQYMSDRARLNNLQQVREKIEADFNQDNDTLAKAQAGLYDPYYTKQQHDFLANTSLQDIVSRGLQLPRIREAFDAEKNIFSKADPVTYEDSRVVGNQKIDNRKFLDIPTRRNAINTISSSLGGKEWFQRQTGLSVEKAQLLPDKLDDIKKFNNDFYKSTPQGQQVLVQNGITDLNSDAYKNFIEQQSALDYQGKKAANGIINTYIDRARAKANEFLKVNPDFSLRDQQLQEQRNYREQVRFNERNQDKSTGSAAQPTDISIPYNEGNATVNARGYIPVSIPKKNFAGVPAYDLTSGQTLPQLQSSGDYSIVGVGNFPFISNPNAKDNLGNTLNGTVAQPNYQKQNPNSVKERAMIHVQSIDPVTKMTNDYLIDYNKLPQNVKNSKSVKEALSNFVPAKEQSSQLQQPAKKVIYRSQIASKAKAAGYSINEYTELLRKNGITIQ